MNKKFSFDSIEDFDKHIDLSIPNYSGLIDHILNLSTYFVKDNSVVYDLGCSTGIFLNKLSLQNTTKNCKFIGIDKSDNLINKSPNSNIILENKDLLKYTYKKCNFVTSIFTLQFLSIEERKRLLKTIYSNLESGGAMIIAEKVFMNDGFIQDMFTFAYYDFKRKSFKQEEITSKQFDLRYIMRPLSDSENIKLFNECGFEIIQTIWQNLQFKSWILLKK